jgi:hypothetical protein
LVNSWTALLAKLLTQLKLQGTKLDYKDLMSSSALYISHRGA